MKTQYKFLTLLFALAAASSAQSQDTLQYRDGRLEAGTVTEITSTLVVFKKAALPNGPTYSEFKNDIEQIKFNNGSIEKFEYKEPEAAVPVIKDVVFTEVKHNPQLKAIGQGKYSWDNAILGNRETYNVLLNLNDKRISHHISLAKEQAKGQYIGFAAIPCALAAGFFGLSASYGGIDVIEGSSVAGVAAVAGIACLATSITLKVKRTRNENAAVKLYQQKY